MYSLPSDPLLANFKEKFSFFYQFIDPKNANEHDRIFLCECLANLQESIIPLEEYTQKIFSTKNYPEKIKKYVVQQIQEIFASTEKTSIENIRNALLLSPTTTEDLYRLVSLLTNPEMRRLLQLSHQINQLAKGVSLTTYSQLPREEYDKKINQILDKADEMYKTSQDEIISEGLKNLEESVRHDHIDITGSQ